MGGTYSGARTGREHRHDPVARSLDDCASGIFNRCPPFRESHGRRRVTLGTRLLGQLLR